MASERVFHRFNCALEKSHAYLSRTTLGKWVFNQNCDLARSIAQSLESTYTLVFGLLDAELEFAAQPFCMPILLMENRLAVLKCADTISIIFNNAHNDFLLMRRFMPPDCGWLVHTCRNVVDDVDRILDTDKRIFESAQGRIVQKELELTSITAQTLLEPTSPKPTSNEQADQFSDQVTPTLDEDLTTKQAALSNPLEPDSSDSDQANKAALTAPLEPDSSDSDQANKAALTAPLEPAINDQANKAALTAPLEPAINDQANKAALTAPLEPEWVAKVSVLAYLKLDAVSRHIVRDELARKWQVQDEIDICAQLAKALKAQDIDQIARLLGK
jgi:hypothetical protein